MKYLLDTNICIAIIKRNSGNALARLTACQPGDVGLSTISVAELRFGVAKSRFPEKNAQALEGFLLPLTILDFDYRAATVYGALRADLEKRGCPIGALDTLIASQAVAFNLILVTYNTKEFCRISELTVEDWIP